MCMPVALSRAFVVWALVVTIATSLVTRVRRDSFVYTPALEYQYSREQSPKSRETLARVSSRSWVGTSGCREYENPAVVLVAFLGGLANIGQVLLSVRDVSAVAERACLRVGDQRSGEVPERSTTMVRAESLVHTQREGNSSKSEKYHCRGVETSAGTPASCQKGRSTPLTSSG